jgi:hypothetical protein
MRLYKKKYLFPLLLILLLTGHSFLMNGYYSSHRYLTVATYFSSIRNQINPELFKNSIYIQAVNRDNLRIGIFYDALPYVLQYIDLELFALLHTAAGLFFMLAGIYALALTLTRSRAAAIVATILYTTQLNNWTLGSPSPYLNFFHHGLPYTYPLIVWSMFLFFRTRYRSALLLTGLSYNFHPMCSLFLLCAYGLYWLLNIQKFPRKLTLLCLTAFTLPALPGIAKTVSHIGSGGRGPLWLEGVRWVAGYTCNPSTWEPRQLLQAGLFLILAGTSLYAFPKRAIRRTIMIFWGAVACMCLVGTIFADILPIPFIIKLSLWRSTVIYLYLAIIIIAWACVHIARKSSVHALLAVTLITLLTGYLAQLPYYFLAMLLPAFIYSLFTDKTDQSPHRGIILSALTLALLYVSFYTAPLNALWLATFMASSLLIIVISSSAYFTKPRRLLLWAIGLMIFDSAVLASQGGPKIYYHGKIQGELDPWADVQFVARDISHRDDLFIVPPLHNDFYHYSLRAVLGDWAEGSTLLYLDNRFTEEWFERMHDLGWTAPDNAETGFNELSTDDILRIGRKYNARFVVTEKPKEFDLPVIYANSRFILYRITRSGDQ